MNRLIATLCHDFLIQWRNGFYYVTFVLAAFWVVLLLQAGTLNLRWLMPGMAIGNLLIGTFFFFGGLVLLEKDERTPLALRVTPLRFEEYLGSKILTLAIPALAETILIAGIALSWNFAIGMLGLGLLFAAIIYCLIGYIAVFRVVSLNSYLLPAGGLSALLWMPLLAPMAGWDSWLWLLHPLGGALMITTAAFVPASLWQNTLAIASTMIWLVVLTLWARKQETRRQKN